MTKTMPEARNDGSVYVRPSEDGKLVLRMSELTWETDFFGRRFGRLELDTKAIHDVEATALDQALKDALSFGDQHGFEVIELRLDISWLDHICILEDHGFRLVDTSIRFIRFRSKTKEEALPISTDQVCFAREEMKEELLDLTRRSFANNPSFKSRFKNERFFSPSDTERYYSAWIERYVGDENTLFAVMKDEGKIVGYLIYTRRGEYREKPLYKAALIAVAPEHRGKRIYFALTSFVYRHFPESEVYLDATTQLSNLSTIRNLIKSRRTLDSVQMIFYRPRQATTPTPTPLPPSR